MNNTMNYKGYTARVEFDPRDEIFIGCVLGIEDRITFHGETVAKLMRAAAAPVVVRYRRLQQ
jgi:predicted HicB family RNase H-like nuclease